MIKSIIFLLLLNILAIAGYSQAADPQKRHQNYLQVNRQIYARHGDPGSGKLNTSDDKIQLLTEQLHEIISQEIETALASAKASDSSIAGAILELQGDLSMAGRVPDMDMPYAKFLTVNGVQTLAVGYVILRGGDAIPDSQPYLEFYGKPAGIWEKKASAPTLSDFQGFTFSVAQLNSGLPSEAWFLAWGIPCGNSQGSEYLRLYAFDGSTVRTIWKRGPLPAGNVTVTPDTVTLDYRDEESPTGLAHEVLHVTLGGLQ
jgi:hypothetical protein